jgi:hypothetical protein
MTKMMRTMMRLMQVCDDINGFNLIRVLSKDLIKLESVNVKVDCCECS